MDIIISALINFFAVLAYLISVLFLVILLYVIFDIIVSFIKRIVNKIHKSRRYGK